MGTLFKQNKDVEVYGRLSEISGAIQDSLLLTVCDEIGVDKDAGFLR